MTSLRNLLTEEVISEEDISEAVSSQNSQERFHDYIDHVTAPTDPDAHQRDMHEVVVYQHPSLKRPMGPSPSSMVAKGQEHIDPEANLHKGIRAGFSKALGEMHHETPEQSKTKLKASRGVADKFAQSYGYKRSPDLLRTNGKLVKSGKVKFNTVGLSLAPHETSGLNGFNVCPNSSSECRQNCLGLTAGGNKRYESAQSSKIYKTHLLAVHPEHFARIMDDEISAHTKASHRQGMKPAVRLNVTSDIPFHKYAASAEHGGQTIHDRHPGVQFYDYTKNQQHVGAEGNPKNLALGLSHTGTNHPESNDRHVAAKLAGGHVAAMVFKKGDKLPSHVHDAATGARYPVVNGDEDDAIFLRHKQAKRTPGRAGHGVVSGLRVKGVGNESMGHFANDTPANGIATINKPKMTK